MSKKKILTVVLTLLVAVCLLATTALAAVAATGVAAPTNPTTPSGVTTPTTPTTPTNPTAPTQPTTPTQPTEPAGPKFVDVAEGDWFYNSVMWAVENGVTVGTTATTFEPTKGCTRAEMVEFLWNAAGQPEATIKTVNFTDVPASGSDDFWYEESLLWAVESGIVAGTNDGTTFSPNQVCSRAEMVSFLARLLADGATDDMPFVDVPASAWYYNEVLWAWVNGLTNGTTATTFSPDKTCTRAEAVEFLYNAFAE